MRPISLVSTLVFSFGVIVLLLFIIIPQIKDSALLIIEKVPQYYASIVAWIEGLVERYQIDFNTEILNINFDRVKSLAEKYLTTENTSTLMNITMNFTSSLISGLVNFFLGLIVSIYMLAEKERILSFVKKFFGALLPKKAFEKTCHVCLKKHLKKHVMFAKSHLHLFQTLLVVSLQMHSFWEFSVLSV